MHAHAHTATQVLVFERRALCEALLQCKEADAVATCRAIEAEHNKLLAALKAKDQTTASVESAAIGLWFRAAGGGRRSWEHLEREVREEQRLRAMRCADTAAHTAATEVAWLERDFARAHPPRPRG